MPQKKQVHRMCIITRKVVPRSELFRIVRTSEHTIALEEGDKVHGRGMHVLKSLNIIPTLFSEKKKGLWKHALKCEIPEKEKQEILQQIEKILRETHSQN